MVQLFSQLSPIIVSRMEYGQSVSSFSRLCSLSLFHGRRPNKEFSSRIKSVLRTSYTMGRLSFVPRPRDICSSSGCIFPLPLQLFNSKVKIQPENEKGSPFLCLPFFFPFSNPPALLSTLSFFSVILTSISFSFFTLSS